MSHVLLITWGGDFQGTAIVRKLKDYIYNKYVQKVCSEEAAYRAYAKDVTGKDALSKQTLTNYFRSHSAYIGSIDGTRFTWEALDQDKRTMVKHTTTTSAYMFKYDILCEQLNGIDFERVVSAAEDNTETAAPTTPAEPVKNNEPEIAGIDPNKDPFA